MGEYGIPCTICALALGNFLVKRRKASAGMTARVVSSVARAIVPGWTCVRSLDILRWFLRFSGVVVGRSAQREAKGVGNFSSPGWMVELLEETEGDRFLSASIPCACLSRSSCETSEFVRLPLPRR